MKLQLEYRWIDGSSWFVPFSLFLWAMVVAFVGTVRYLAGDVYIPIVCAFISITANYLAVAFSVNRTRLTATERQIEITHEPVPWFGERTLPVNSIDSFTYKEHPNATGAGSHFIFYCNMIDRSRNSIFWGVPIGKPEEPIQVISKLKEWLAPFRLIEFVTIGGRSNAQA